MSDSDDELIAADRAPRWVRWAALSIAGALAAVLAGVLVSRHHGTPTTQPNPQPTSSIVARPAAPPDTAVAETGDVRWELQRRNLSAETVVGPGHFARIFSLPRPFAASGGKPMVTVDPVTGLAWIVLADRRPALLVQVSLGLARIVRVVPWGTAVIGAAAYAGHLYLSTGQGVADLAPHAAHPRRVSGLAEATGPVVVDPSRHRLIAIDLGPPTRLWTFGPHAAAVGVPGSLPLREATTAVVDGAIWILGRAGDGAVLERLDPATLRPVARPRLPVRLSEGSVLIGGSGRALWLSGPLPSDYLICADAETGAALQTWPMPGVGSVAARHGRALLAVGSRFREIKLGRCPA